MKKILAVTACPTGVAHTYMAAESLIKAAKEKNIPLKVETRGAVGVEN
jgi:PTS system fructose-specific IIC component